MKTKRFRGLNTVDSGVLHGPSGIEHLVRADNVLVTATGRLELREGYSVALPLSGVIGAYATLDERRFYVQAGDTMRVMLEAQLEDNESPYIGSRTIAAGLSTTRRPVFTEAGNQVLFTNGLQSGIINPDHRIIDWHWDVPPVPYVTATSGTLPAGLYRVRVAYRLADGRITGASETAHVTLAAGQGLSINAIPQHAGYKTLVFIAPANSDDYGLANADAPATMFWSGSANDLGLELNTIGFDPLPDGCDVLAHWRGRVYAAMYVPASGATAIYRSQPLGFHLFNITEDFDVVPGRVLMLAPHAEGLIVGTDVEIGAIDREGKYSPLAPYGVMPGAHWSLKDQGGDSAVVFMSVNGICQGLPFVNHTEQQHPIPAGLSACGIVVRNQGLRYLAVVQLGVSP